MHHTQLLNGFEERVKNWTRAHEQRDGYDGGSALVRGRKYCHVASEVGVVDGQYGRGK